MVSEYKQSNERVDCFGCTRYSAAVFRFFEHCIRLMQRCINKKRWYHEADKSSRPFEFIQKEGAFLVCLNVSE